MTRILATCAFGLAWTTATWAQAAADAPVQGNTTIILVTTIVGFLTLIATNVFALWRESRNRRWDEEDRARARELQRQETLRAAGALATVVQSQHAEIKAEVQKNTAITQEIGKKAEAAYEAANNFNNKLAEVKKVVLPGDES